jgi:hypothetical protein
MTQSAGASNDAVLRLKLVHYLNPKNQHGFYELLSSTNYPFTMPVLLNLLGVQIFPIVAVGSHR